MVYFIYRGLKADFVTWSVQTLRRETSILPLILAAVIIVNSLGNAGAVSAPEVVVTAVYWGTNPLGGVSVHPGDTNIPLSIVLSNAGDATARAVNAKLVLTEPFSYVYYAGGERHTADTVDQNAGDILPGFSFTLWYALTIAPDAAAGVHRLTLILNYKTARELSPVQKTLNVDVPVWTGDVRVQYVLTVPSKVFPGDNQVNVKVWLVNAGTGSTADLQTRLILESPFSPTSGGSDLFFIGTMQPGQVSETDFHIDISDTAKFGSYNLPLVSESPASTGQVEVGQVLLYVSEKDQFELVKVEPSTVRAGDSGVSIRIAIKNAGSVTADSVRVQLRVGNYFSGTLTDFLGTMQPGESKTAFLTVDVDSKAPPQAYRFDLRIEWTQSDVSLDETLPVEVQVETAELPIPLIAIGLVLVALVIVVAVRRRRKSRS